jgi:23S rRNA (uracil1939-C5)-methyltransferase
LEQRFIAQIVDWNQEGRGVARVDGKAVFIDEALPGEVVEWQPVRVKKSYSEGRISRVLMSADARVQPPCKYYVHCGGCNSQHIEFTTQVALKQRAWLNQMRRLGKVLPDELMPPIYGLPWHYRERVRLRAVYEDGRLMLGFQARRSHAIVDIDGCLVLPVELSEALNPIKALLQSWPVGCVQGIMLHRGNKVIALTLQVCGEVNQTMRRQVDSLLVRLQQQSGCLWQWWLQTGRTTTLQSASVTPVLAYDLPEYQLEIPYQPEDFTQVNQATNELMIQRAMQWLQPQAGERIIDWFCGLGNFSLPIARMQAEVVGVEGMEAMCQRARGNAQYNGLAQLARFQQADLFAMSRQRLRRFGYAHKWLLDPPRAGAQALILALSELEDRQMPSRIVYVSCDPATLARDAGLLVKRGYFYRAGGIMNLFAQTAHVESMAVFDWR